MWWVYISLFQPVGIFPIFYNTYTGPYIDSETKTPTYSIDSTWYTLMCSHPTRVIAQDLKRTTLSPC